MRFIQAFCSMSALCIVATSANAMSCTSAATYTLDDSTAAACFAGNDNNVIAKDPNFVLFGQSGWLLADKNDDNTVGSPITFLDAPANGDKSGTWQISGWAAQSYNNLVITLKAGNGFGAFLLDENTTSGTWASTKGLSHASIFYQNTPLTTMPLPAGAWLLISGFAGMGLARRFKNKAMPTA